MNNLNSFTLFYTIILFYVAPGIASVEFTHHTILESFQGGTCIAGADFDGDSDIDIVATGTDGNLIGWLENDGKENFTQHVISNTFGGARVLDVADIDSDGDTDVICTAFTDNKISWFENDSSGNFTEHVITDSWIGPGYVYAAYIDDDNFIDIIATSCESNIIGWFENNSNQNFTEHILKTNWYKVNNATASDIDLDGDNDIIATAKAGNILWFENDGNENFTENTIINNWGTPSSVCAADLDGDGDIDLAATSCGAREVSWFENDGNQVFSQHILRTNFPGARSITISDIDNDNDNDILAVAWGTFTSDSGAVASLFENDGSGYFTEMIFCDYAYDLIKIYIKDLDGDDDLDILGACYAAHQIRWWENNLYHYEIAADVRSGHMPLHVQFSDQCNTSRPITFWNWDFDNDGTFDSNLQNPTFEYSVPGTYAVRLEITMDTLIHTIIKENFINVFDGKSAIKFIDDEDYVYFPAIPTFNLTENFTIELVAKPTNWGNGLYGSTIFDKSAIKLFITGNAFGPMGDYSLGADLILLDETLVKLSAPDNMIDLDIWQHIAVSYNASLNQFKMYINGIECTVTVIGSNQPSGALFNNENDQINLGNDLELSYGYEGTLDEFRLWNVVRSDYDILENMDNNLAGNETGLIGYWKMDEGNGIELIDTSPTGNNGQIEYARYTQGVDLSTIINNNPENKKLNLPQEFMLKQNYPNPFNPSTTIKFSIPSSEFVTLKVYNLLGQDVATLVSDNLKAGDYTYSWNAGSLAGGVYIYKIQAGSYQKVNKMILLK